jgi:hypothetical protein
MNRLVESPTEWRWSSARWYHEPRTVGVSFQWVTDETSIVRASCSCVTQTLKAASGPSMKNGLSRPGGCRESVPGRCGGGSPRRRSRSVRPLRSTWTGCEPVEDSLSPRRREGTRTLSDLSVASSGPTRRKTLSHLFEIVRPGLLVASETRESRPRKRIRRNAPFTLTRLGGSGCRQLLAQIEVVPGLSCPSKRPDNPAMCGS